MGLKPITEAQFLKQVVAYARLQGFVCAHFRPGRTAAGGWRTACQFDAKGLPDLILARPRKGSRPGRVVFAEVKTDRGRLTKEQAVWILTLQAAGAEVYCWAPRDWETIEAILAR